MSKLEIVSMGKYIPPKSVTNDDLSTVMDTNDEWITTRTGIKTRHYATETTKEMAIKSSVEAIKKANIDPKQIDLVVVSTITADDITPSVACSILHDLGINNVMAFDVNAACSGFIYALNVASSIIESNNLNYALVIGVEKLSKLLDYTDRSTAILFGDGSSSCIIKRTNKDAYFACHAKTDIENVLYAKGIEASNTLFKNSKMDNFFLTMNGQEVYKFAISASIEAINDVLLKANMTLDDIDLIIPHQANIRIIESIQRRLKLDSSKFYNNVSKYGNTSAASVPLALTEAMEENKIKKGDKILLVGFGSGLTYAATIIEM